MKQRDFAKSNRRLDNLFHRKQLEIPIYELSNNNVELSDNIMFTYQLDNYVDLSDKLYKRINLENIFLSS